MITDAATNTSTPAPQAAAAAAGAASGTQPAQPAPATPAPQPTPVQLLWEVARLAFGLMTRLVHVLQPIQQYYPKQALLLARVLIDIPRILLTIRYAPERVTMAQLRHLTRARHLLQALFNYTLPSSLGTPISRLASAAPVSQSPLASIQNATPLGERTPSSANATVNQHPTPSLNPATATPLGARTPSSATTPSPAISTTPSLTPTPSATPGARKPSSATPATPSIRQVPGIPMVAGVSQVPASSTVNNSQFPPDPSHTSPTSHPSQASPSPQSANNNSAFSPYIPDVHTLLQALKADSLPASCAGALFEEPGEALVRALHQLHAIYFSLYPNQSPSPTPSQSPSPSQSLSPSQSPSNGNLQSSICNPQSGHPQSDTPSVHPVHPVHPASPVQSEISNLKSEIPVPHSTSPP